LISTILFVLTHHRNSVLGLKQKIIFNIHTVGTSYPPTKENSQKSSKQKIKNHASVVFEYSMQVHNALNNRLGKLVLIIQVKINFPSDFFGQL